MYYKTLLLFIHFTRAYSGLSVVNAEHQVVDFMPY